MGAELSQLNHQIDYQQLAAQIKTWATELGFQQTAITDLNLDTAGQRLQQWLDRDYQGTMGWMAEQGDKRFKPEQLLPGTLRVITLRMDYLPPDSNLIAVLKDDNKAYLSRYALGRDYHKLIRKRLTTLAGEIKRALPPDRELIQRPFVDSAPVMEKALAEKSGLGWIGKNTLLLNSAAGSWFFLGEIYTNLPLPLDHSTQRDQCGGCTACIKVCPTDAFPQPYVLDARRCISYLTIEHKGSIPEEFREPIGNRVFGCDDCQAICPWNKYAQPSVEKDFLPRHQLDDLELTKLFGWSEKEFLKKTEGSPIRRIGYERWQRNLAIGLGNAPRAEAIVNLLKHKLESASEMAGEHILWALQQQEKPGRKRKRKISSSNS